MKRIDKIYILDLIIKNQSRREYDYELMDKLIETGYLDWFTWFNEKSGRYEHKINATHKGMLYYTENKNRSGKGLVVVLFIALLILPVALILMEGIL